MNVGGGGGGEVWSCVKCKQKQNNSLGHLERDEESDKPGTPCFLQQPQKLETVFSRVSARVSQFIVLHFSNICSTLLIFTLFTVMFCV